MALSLLKHILYHGRVQYRTAECTCPMREEPHSSLAFLRCAHGAESRDSVSCPPARAALQSPTLPVLRRKVFVLYTTVPLRAYKAHSHQQGATGVARRDFPRDSDVSHSHRHHQEASCVARLDFLGDSNVFLDDKLL